eukprot:gene27413-27824_t
MPTLQNTGLLLQVPVLVPVPSLMHSQHSGSTLGLSS